MKIPPLRGEESKIIIPLKYYKKYMRQFHIIRALPFDKEYDSLLEAHIDAQKIHVDLLKRTSFDINQYINKLVLRFEWNDQTLVIYFQNNTLLSISIDSNDCIVFDNRNNCNKYLGSEKIINLIYQDTIEEWKPLDSLSDLQNKRFQDIFFVGKHRIYLYFYESQYILSISVLKIKEFPHSLLHWNESF
jgi:hypothetical protein